jgi:uncharacterized protein
MNRKPVTPKLSVKFDGRAVDDRKVASVLEATVIQDVEAVGSFEIVAHLWDEEAQRPLWIEDSWLTEGLRVELLMGLRGAPASVFVGELTGVAIDYPDRAPATLTLRGYDCRHRLMRGARSQSYVNVRDSEVAKKIAGLFDVPISAESSPLTHKCLLQVEQTDYEFLQQRAAAIGYELAVKGDTLLFRPPPLHQSPVRSLDVTEDLIEFRASLSTMRQVDRVVVRGWDVARKKHIETALGDREADAEMGGVLGSARAKRGFEAATHRTAAWPVTVAQEAKLLARGLLVAGALRHVRGEAVAPGDPALAAGAVVAFKQAAERFDGNYYITQATHRFSQRSAPSYRTTLGLRRTSS